MLPHHDAIQSQTRRVFFIGARIVIEEPPTMAVPKSAAGIVGIALPVAMGVMPDVVGGPFESGILKRPPPGNQERDLDGIRTVETPVGHQSMIANSDAKTRYDVEDDEEHPIQPCVTVPVSEGRNSYGGSDEEQAKHNNGGDTTRKSGREC